MSTAAAQPQQEPAPETGNAASNECKVADLKLSLSNGDGAAGHYYRSLIFTNKASRECTIQGFPGVSYVTGDDGHQVGEAAFRDGKKGAPIVLKPGDNAYAEIGFLDVGAIDEGTCKPTETRGLRVYPPHSYDSMFVPAAGRGCAGGTPNSHQLTVRTIEPGTGPS